MRGAAEREASAERSAMAAPGPDGVQEAYTSYAAQGGDGADNWAARAKERARRQVDRAGGPACADL